MEVEISIGAIRPEEADAVFRLVERVTRKMVCQDFDVGGADEFFAAVTFMLYERPKDHLALVARQAGCPIGYIHVRDRRHICLFFVDLDAQGRGVGRRLFEEALQRCYPRRDPFFEVNASLYAVPIYKALGFRKVSNIQLLNGIRFVEMEYGARPSTQPCVINEATGGSN
jgi:GNAT superfamily N-acetyltransferase